MFSEAYDMGKQPMQFVNEMRKKGQLIMGIGHRVKSVSLVFTKSFYELYTNAPSQLYMLLRYCFSLRAQQQTRHAKI